MGDTYCFADCTRLGCFLLLLLRWFWGLGLEADIGRVVSYFNGRSCLVDTKIDGDRK